MTANALEGDRERCIAAGMDDYITKPVRVDLLGQKLDQWMQRGATMDESLDREVLATLREMGDDDAFYLEIIDLFINDTPSQLNALRAALAAGNVNGTGVAAHTIKSAAANVGATPMSKTADELEKLARDSRLDSASELAAQLDRQFASAAAALEEEKRRITSEGNRAR
jgi:two-component system, sensor histidine kinase and response regulator